MKIKICGICRPEDADAAVEEGADLLGFVFAPSPRRADPAVVRPVVRRLPAHVEAVGVFLNQPVDEVRRTLESAGLSIAQLHGSETPEEAAALGARVIKSFTTYGRQSLEALAGWDAWAFLLDVPKGAGGRSAVDPDFALCARKYGRVFLAGRLHAGTVGDAIRRVRPFGVDVASGVESAPGVKDRAAVRAFIRAARAAHRDTQTVKVSVR